MTKKIMIVAMGTVALLAIPMALMLFQVRVLDPGDGWELVSWSPFDFFAAGLLLFSSGLSYVLAARNAKDPGRRILIGLAVFLALAFIWVGLATGF